MNSDDQPLLVFFRSEQSGPARRMDSPIAHLARRERDRLRVTVVDVDRQPELAERFAVTTVPVLVLIKDRQVVGRLDGRVSAPKIDRLLALHFPARTRVTRPAPAAAVA